MPRLTSTAVMMTISLTALVTVAQPASTPQTRLSDVLPEDVTKELATEKERTDRFVEALPAMSAEDLRTLVENLYAERLELKTALARAEHRLDQLEPRQIEGKVPPDLPVFREGMTTLGCIEAAGRNPNFRSPLVSMETVEWYFSVPGEERSSELELSSSTVPKFVLGVRVVHGQVTEVYQEYREASFDPRSWRMGTQGVEGLLGQ